MSASQYTIDLSSVTVANGVYVLTLMPTGSGIRDLADNAFTVAASDTWTKETFNNPPTLDDIPDPGPIDEDAVQQTITLTGISAGIGENQAIALTAQSDTLGLVDVLEIDYEPGSTTATLLFTPVPDAWGSAEITVTVEDAGLDGHLNTHGDNAHVSRSFNVTVNPVEDTLFAFDDSYAGTENAVLAVEAPGVLLNDITVGGHPLCSVLISPPTHGALAFHCDGSFTYTPNKNFNREDSFSYRANDGVAESQTARC